MTIFAATEKGKKMQNKPVIRHCYNCQYANRHDMTNGLTCGVKYKWILSGERRIKAMLCKYYRPRTEG